MVEKKRFKQGLMSPLVLCLITILILPGCSFSKGHREGVQLTVNTTSGDSVKGELLMVKDDDSLVIVSGGNGVNVPAKKIRGIKVRKPGGKIGRSALRGFGYGALIGAGLGAGFSAQFDSSEGVPLSGAMLLFGKIFGVVGTAIGIIIGAAGSIGYHVRLEGKPDRKIKKAIDKLRKKARIQGD